ncbi:MFS transporter [Pannonibacter sp. SL95]|uniref:MFS transporter n=1 Tax=Pannonibacter sp. SL95 TaxID=2995153 RepID=UPI0022755A44|nr:MFS transporter [Pannonibacter sp. SL95]MCY1707269.1 MFS transporter [Pannonibacter sp. SL95]
MTAAAEDDKVWQPHAPEKPKAPSAWAPFRSRIFAVIWGASLVSNIGIWMRDVASGWLMTDLAPSPLMVSLVQAALLLPVLLFALPAGALADILDRRRMLIAVQVFLAAVSFCMAAVVAAEAMTPLALLLFTFAAGVGAALTQPAFQAIVPELVPRTDLRAAVALNSMGINVARAIGPALGGVVLAVAGVTVAYLLDALSTLVAIAAFVWWRRPPPERTLSPERLGPAMRTGMTYALRAPALHRVLLRALAFFLFASAYWALLPLIARDLLAADATFYGLMLTFVGAGAVAGALVLPRVGQHFAPSTLVSIGSLVTALAMAGLAVAPPTALVLGLLGLAGLAWITVLTSLGVAAQTSLPDWVRARGLAVYLMVFYGSMAAGSALWGQLAALTDIPTALIAAATGGVLAALAATTAEWPGGSSDLRPAGHWPKPDTAQDVGPDAGPVLVTLNWHVAPEQRAAFLAEATAFSHRRRRDGAFGWQIWEDLSTPGLYVESYMAMTWADHLRQHARITADDAAAQAHLNSLAEAPPVVHHHIAARNIRTEAEGFAV